MFTKVIMKILHNLHQQILFLLILASESSGADTVTHATTAQTTVTLSLDTIVLELLGPGEEREYAHSLPPPPCVRRMRGNGTGVRLFH